MSKKSKSFMGAINPTMANRFKKYENGGEVEQSYSTFENNANNNHTNMVLGKDMSSAWGNFKDGKDIGTSITKANPKTNPLGGVQDTLSVLGLAPGLGGVAADVANAGLSIGQGNFKEGATSLLSAVDPTGFLGSATTGGMIGNKIGEKLSGVFKKYEKGGEVPKKDKKSLQDLVFDKHDVEYKGEIPLGLDEFPMVKDILEKGKRSNINTRSYEWHDDDGKEHYQLDAGMHKGKILNEQEGKNLGSYNSPKERQKADDAIHEYQSMLSPDLDIRRDGQITANNVKALRAEIEKELLGN
jgi:hypothetical protein